jgi:hypothetical protein
LSGPPAQKPAAVQFLHELTLADGAFSSLHTTHISSLSGGLAPH